MLHRILMAQLTDYNQQLEFVEQELLVEITNLQKINHQTTREKKLLIANTIDDAIKSLEQYKTGVALEMTRIGNENAQLLQVQEGELKSFAKQLYS